mgnify:FL=1
MFKKIYKEIKKYQTIVIARHIGADPDALASQFALKESLQLTFPEKKIYAVGSGSSKFSYLGKLDKWQEQTPFLLIVLDTPDLKRIDFANVSKAASIIKIDHHPFIETVGNIEYIDDKATSTCEILMEFLQSTKLTCNEEIASLLYSGLISDSNRFLFDSSTPKTFALVSDYLKNYPFALSEVYKPLYLRPLKEVRLEGYIATHLSVSKNKVAFCYLSNDIVEEYNVDSAAAGNMINNFNYIDEILVWMIATEDVKNHIIRVNIRSRGPVINKVAEQYRGGGHKLASGARVTTYQEVQQLVASLNEVTQEYIRSEEEHENNKC